MRAILSRQYGVDRILYYEPGSPFPQALGVDNIGEQHIRLITGHHPFGIHQLIRMPCRSFTIIRDPIKRLLSDYYYAYSYSDHRYRADIVGGALTAEKFITNPRYGGRNAESEMLAGDSISIRGPARAALDTAEHCFVAVGVTERFDESVLLIAKTLGWHPPIFVKKNVTRLDDKLDAERRRVETAARDKYGHLFATEYEVYEGVDALLSRRIAAEGEAFARALALFRGMQADIAVESAQEIYEPYEFAKVDRLPPFAARFIGSQPYRELDAYLQSDSLVVPQIRNYVGAVDSMEGDTIDGWASDLWRDEPVTVTVYRRGEPLGSVRCGNPRDDVLHAGYGRSDVGFRVQLREPITDPREYAVCFDDTSLLL